MSRQREVEGVYMVTTIEEFDEANEMLCVRLRPLAENFANESEVNEIAHIISSDQVHKYKFGTKYKVVIEEFVLEKVKV